MIILPAAAAEAEAAASSNDPHAALSQSDSQPAMMHVVDNMETTT